MNSLPSAAEYRVPNHRVSAVDKGGAGGAGSAGSAESAGSAGSAGCSGSVESAGSAGGIGGDRAPPEFCDSKKTTEIEIDRQYVTTNSPEFEKISMALRIDIPESTSRCLPMFFKMLFDLLL